MAQFEDWRTSTYGVKFPQAVPQPQENLAPLRPTRKPSRRVFHCRRRRSPDKWYRIGGFIPHHRVCFVFFPRNMLRGSDVNGRTP